MTLRIIADENILVTPSLQRLDALLTRKSGRDIRSADLSAADVLLVRSVTSVDSALLTDTPVRFVGSATAGVDHIDQDYLQAQNIGFCSAPGSNANAVAEYTLATLAACDQLNALMAGGAVGIIGYGHVGKRLSVMLRALGACIKVWDPLEAVPDEIRASDLAEVLQLPVVTLHASLHAEDPWPSRGMIDVEQLTPEVNPVLVINAARGELITTDALNHLLTGGTRLALDVWPEEPVIEEALLRRVVSGTPHIAGYTWEAKAAATDALVRGIEEHFGLITREITNQDLRGEALRLGACHDSPGGLLKSLLLSAYDPRNDFAQLRAVAGGRADGQAFDRLRREYPLRRELRGRRVTWQGKMEPQHLDGVFEALGVIID